MAKIRIAQSEQTIFCREGENLMEVLLGAGVFVDNPCNGKGICGKCKVKISEGRVSPCTQTEMEHIGKEEREGGIRLSCMTQIFGDLEVELVRQERDCHILDQGFLPEFHRDRVEEGYGMAVDIGTTTVVTSLIDLKTGEEIGTASRINAQKQYGLDVLTRITYEQEHGEAGIQDLQNAIVGALNEMILEMCRKAAITPAQIREIDISANCTMMHMLLGVDARSIGRAPYQPGFLDAKTLKAADIGLKAGKDTVLYCLPQVSAYIGADIVAGAYVCQLSKASGNVLFIDIGTNGEIVLASGGRLLCCSCAAGPALEGMNISAGMRAEEGAVEEVEITEAGVRLTTIGNASPRGICGSGILAVLRELLRTGLVKKSGVFIKMESVPEEDCRKKLLRAKGTKREFVLCQEPELVVTQRDIRQVQLAKGAILSGFTALLDRAGLRMEELDLVLVAGQFGAHLPAESLAGTGILPREVREKIVYVGNSSKNGAYMALLSQKAKTDMEELAKTMEYQELAEIPGYERIFAECMMFPEWVEKGT